MANGLTSLCERHGVQGRGALVSGKASCGRPIAMGMARPFTHRMPAKSSEFHLVPLHNLLYTAARKAQDAVGYRLRADWVKKSA